MTYLAVILVPIVLFIGSKVDPKTRSQIFDAVKQGSVSVREHVLTKENISLVRHTAASILNWTLKRLER